MTTNWPDMTEMDLLLQRFLDQELSADERLQFVIELGRNGILRERLIELEQVALDASRLPRAAVPADFVSRVVDRATGSRPAWRRVADALLTPHTLQWNGAMALAAAVLIFILGGLTVGRFRAPSSSPSAPALADASGETQPPAVLVRLVVLQPEASSVQVAGDFNAWNPDRTPLEPVANGAWTVTIPLQPGRYEYMFVVDGQTWVEDPFAIEHSDDGFGARNAVLDVRPPGMAPL